MKTQKTNCPQLHSSVTILISRLWYLKSQDGCLRRLLCPGILFNNQMRPRYDWWHFLVHNSTWKPLLKMIFQAMVDPLPKERWNSTAASCSSNTIGPLCSDVIEKNWNFCTAPSAGFDQIGNQNPGHWEDQHFENVTLQVIRHLSPGHFYGQYWKTSEWYCTAESIIWDARLYTEMGRLTISTEMVLDFSICTFQNLLYCVQEIEHDWHF